jgi:hypothetical protein
MIPPPKRLRGDEALVLGPWRVDWGRSRPILSYTASQGRESLSGYLDHTLCESRRTSSARARFGPLVIAIVLFGACADTSVSADSTTTTQAQPTTSTAASTTTSTRALTTTSGISTTIDPSWHGPEPCIDCDRYEVVATIPVLACDEPVDGFVGLTPECRGNSPFGGTIAMTLDQTGAVWIADTLRFERSRLLRVDPVGMAIEVIEIPDDVISLLDVEAVPGGLALVWVDALGHAFIDIIDQTGTGRERIPLDPINFGGFEVLSLATVGDLLYVEGGDGLHVALVYIPSGPRDVLRGYDTPYGFYSTRPIRTPEASIPLEVEGELGAVQLVGVNPDGSLVVKVDDISYPTTGTLRVDQAVLWYRRDGTLEGTFKFPLEQQVAPVAYPTCLGDDGYVYGLLTRADHAEIVRFNYAPGT